jgi:bifunctional oligoribonuclease and PAP phosphatase NrnA
LRQLIRGFFLQKKLNKQSITELKAKLTSPKKIVITTHRSPDGDAMGSSLALWHVLNKMGHEVQVITPNQYPEFLHWLPANEFVMEYEKRPKDAARITKVADLIFCLDFNSLKRLENYQDLVSEAKAEKILIDHHQEPEDFATYLYSDTESCSTAQMVYEFIHFMGYEKYLTKEVATCLYVGILTDTGSFRFPSTTAFTHKVVAELMEKGINTSEIYNRIYDNNSHDRLRLLGYVLSEKMEVFKEYRTAIITLSEEELTSFNFQPGDTEGFVNYPLSIKGVCFTAYMASKDGQVKISFRSKGGFSVNQFARSHFNGGGHINASGGYSNLSLEETRKKFIDLLPRYEKELLDS